VLPDKLNGEPTTGTKAPGTPSAMQVVDWLVTEPLHMV
jgi:hypothetical protein